MLYDGLKNLLIIPLLHLVGRRRLPAGVLTGCFLFLYAFLRIFIDLLREYPTTLFGLATGQVLNLLMSVFGLILMVVPLWRRRAGTGATASPAVLPAGDDVSTGIGWRRGLFVVLLLFSLLIPSDWTQDIAARYGKRHPGLRHSLIYPRIDASESDSACRSCVPAVPDLQEHPGHGDRHGSQDHA